MIALLWGFISLALMFSESSSASMRERLRGGSAGGAFVGLGALAGLLACILLAVNLLTGGTAWWGLRLALLGGIVLALMAWMGSRF